jgi:hypothetical protein
MMESPKGFNLPRDLKISKHYSVSENLSPSRSGLPVLRETKFRLAQLYWPMSREIRSLDAA